MERMTFFLENIDAVRPFLMDLPETARRSTRKVSLDFELSMQVEVLALEKASNYIANRLRLKSLNVIARDEGELFTPDTPFDEDMPELDWIHSFSNIDGLEELDFELLLFRPFLYSDDEEEDEDSLFESGSELSMDLNLVLCERMLTKTALARMWRGIFGEEFCEHHCHYHCGDAT